MISHYSPTLTMFIIMMAICWSLNSGQLNDYSHGGFHGMSWGDIPRAGLISWNIPPVITINSLDGDHSQMAGFLLPT